MLLHDDCLNVMSTMPDHSVDLIFTDPPYGVGSKVVIRADGKPDYKRAIDFADRWDMPDGNFWELFFREAFRVLKYGGHILMFALDRQSFLFKYYAHLNQLIEGQSLYWFFASDFPKSTDLSKQLDKHFKAERPVVGQKKAAHFVRSTTGEGWDARIASRNPRVGKSHTDITEPVTPLARKYEGYRYSIVPLKQMVQTILVFQKPYRTGSCLHDTVKMEAGDSTITCGAWYTRQDKYPPNLFSDDITANRLPAIERYNPIYVPKLSRKERGVSTHPTMKPVKLIRRILSFLQTPNKKVVLDPFAGSGTTGVACRGLNYDYILVEKDPTFYQEAKKRLEE
ncbi:MAG: site-specific DNA-methyltransferase [Chryseobacterium sp.]|nr:MAG: site-specific DNA-methyltransferase [Chryseobacterium sp.]